MENIHREVLRQERTFLVQNIDFDDIFDFLIEKDVISKEISEEILHERSKTSKVREY